MNINEIMATLALIVFFGTMLAGFLLRTKRLGDWTKLLRWNVEGLYQALQRRHYK